MKQLQQKACDIKLLYQQLGWEYNHSSWEQWNNKILIAIEQSSLQKIVVWVKTEQQVLPKLYRLLSKNERYNLW